MCDFILGGIWKGNPYDNLGSWVLLWFHQRDPCLNNWRQGWVWCRGEKFVD